MAEVSPLNQLLATNLREQMDRRGWSQSVVAARSGIGQTTVSLYLNPENRKEGKDGKPGSAKLTEVEMLAKALEIEPWELLHPLSERERALYLKFVEDMKKARSQASIASEKPATATKKRATTGV